MNKTDSILGTVKKIAGNMAPEYEYFDMDLLVFTNSTLAILTQLGVGPDKGFLVNDSSAIWNDFIGEGDKNVLFGLVKSYVPLKVRQKFDPSTSTIVSNSLNACIAELEWRIREAAEDLKAEKIKR